jgi:hypothetical protein
MRQSSSFLFFELDVGDAKGVIVVEKAAPVASWAAATVASAEGRSSAPLFNSWQRLARGRSD